MYELLLELKERLNQIAIVGLRSISEDFRLKKLQEKLKLLSSKAPVLAKLYELVTKIIEGEDVTAHFAELNNLVDAILQTQGNSEVEGKETEINLYEHKPIKSLTFLQIQEIRNILNGGTNAKWANLKSAYDEGRLIDYRLVEDFLKNIGDTYEYIDYSSNIPYDQRQAFSMVTIIMQYGEDIIPILLERFETFASTQKVNAIKIIYELGKEKYNDYYKNWVQNEEAESVVIAALKALGTLEENEDFLMNFKTRKKKLQEARILALAKIGSEQAKAEVKKYCLKDENLFLTVFNESPFLNEDELLALVLEKAHKAIEDKDLNKLNGYRNETYYHFLNSLMYYLDNYNIDKVLATYKQIMELKHEESGLYFEARMGNHLIGNRLLDSKHPESLAFLASIKDSYDGYYIAYSFVAALRCYDSQKVYDEFAHLTTNKYAGVKVNIKKILEEIASLDQEVEYNYTCAICEKRETCTSSTFKPHDNEIHLEGRRRISLDLDKIKWDKRWIQYTKKQNLLKCYHFFMIQCMEDTEKETFKAEYIQALEDFKLEVHQSDCYPNLMGKERKSAEQEIKGILTGLLVTGASDVVIEHIPYFSFYLGTLECIMFNYLEEKDLILLDKIEIKIQDLSEYKQKKIREFIEKAKKIVYAKNGKTYGEERYSPK